MKFNKKGSSPQWKDFNPEVKILVRPLSMYTLERLPSDTANFEMSPSEIKNMVTKLIVDWKGIVDENGKELPCNDENKGMVIDYVEMIGPFVMDAASELKEGAGIVKEKESKNLSESPDGETPKSEK